LNLFGAETKYVRLKNGKASYNYEAIYEAIRDRAYFTPNDLKIITGTNTKSLQGVITALSLIYPIYEVSYGKYALLKKEEL